MSLTVYGGTVVVAVNKKIEHLVGGPSAGAEKQDPTAKTLSTTTKTVDFQRFQGLLCLELNFSS